ncbi:ImmA/IrrE family metallo-endopeptidase [Alicyclobacillus tolerans]|uniref:ImmA/IrrE family metallo-endopeptidase n=1 Tax=Alicyclobacillus tolerans TaxID=90970 RepID=UPI001F2F744B|nr:ImmA/IrrE family metallo-endopeptidase [Alicyclobacillus tolerans]MCF8568411.1 ImmA/IrrE family metallo-endopeptidase [Alicyclobacillus tolerans]
MFGFRPVYIFDVAQTDGEPIPAVDSPAVMNGHTGWYESLREACPFPICEVPAGEDGVLGSFSHRTRSIEIVERLPEAQKTKVLIHEWAHGLLHSLTDRPDRETRELEAESTAFVVASALGFDTADYSFGYIVGWRGEEAVKTLKACGTRIQRAADAILIAFRPEQVIAKEAV